jgi:hypothetical protein
MTPGIYIARDAKRCFERPKEFLVTVGITVDGHDPPEMQHGYWRWPGPRTFPIVIGPVIGPLVGLNFQAIRELAGHELQPGELVFVPLGSPKLLGRFKKDARMKKR